MAKSIALAYTKRSGEIQRHFVEQFLKRRLEVAYSLHDLFTLKKERINALIQGALLDGATLEEASFITDLIDEIKAKFEKNLGREEKMNTKKLDILIMYLIAYY
ncbi:hypothetical protein [Candidatus Enterovibrio altilux]|uniref:Uncharacterized protein n=1 Tax=Candidatus Enterovibrio altilux TaxID=1927128 RepID=A0A291B6T0_9GAMM|nr:hypothetical protein [Candidatus Enterovibrio luxaltus]ATF08719.1 hypothetical protein BTN50_0178 [Candidatus Enterovibrio luxaltus]